MEETRIMAITLADYKELIANTAKLRMMEEAMKRFADTQNKTDLIAELDLIMKVKVEL